MRITAFLPRLAFATLAGLLATAPVRAASVTPISMGMTSLSESCILLCTDTASYARNLDSADAPDGRFGSLAVHTSVIGGANAFAASAQGTTTLLGDAGFRVDIALMRPAVGVSTGSYSAGAQLNFSFITDATPDPVVTVAYSVDFVRPVDGSTLDAGVSLGQAFGVPVEPAEATAGTSSGNWTFHLLPNRFYTGRISANIGVAFNAPGGLGEDQMTAVFTVGMPSFAQPVPEPQTAALMLAGLAMLATALRRRAA